MREKEREIPVIGKPCLPRFLCSREIKKVSTLIRGGRDLIRLHDLGLDKRVKSVNAAR